MENACLPSMWSEIDRFMNPDAINGFRLPLVPVFRRVFSPAGFRSFLSSTLRAVFIEPKFPKIPRRGQTAYKFPKFSGAPDDCWIWKVIFNEIFQKLGRNRKFVPFFGSSGKCWSIRHYKYSEMQTGIFGWMERDLTPLILIYPISMDERFLTTLPELFLVTEFN